jgi:hypothetical protein
MKILRDSYLSHSFSNRLPTREELIVDKLAISFFSNANPILYTKNVHGDVIEIGKGVTSLAELDDVDLSNGSEGAFLVKSGDKYVASNFIGDISYLSDVEIVAPVIANQYLRYNSLLEAYSNYYPSYYLSEIVDVDVADPFNQSESFAQNNQVLYYDHASATYKTRPRTNLINELSDVEIVLPEIKFQILALDPADGVWKNSDVKIEYDPNPKLSNNLDANANRIINSSYKLNTLVCDTAIKTLDYSLGDYWILQGVPSTTLNQCVVNINLNTKPNSTTVLLLEVRQNTGTILFGNLVNVKYEDGRILRLSGAGKTDLITITQTSVLPVGETVPTLTTYITSSALNLSTLGSGGVQAFRYDKNRYPYTQEFDLPSRYDDYFDYVESLLTFEPEVSTSKTWLEDKACRLSTVGALLSTTVTTTGVQLDIEKYNLGIEESVLKLQKGPPIETVDIDGNDNNYQHVRVDFDTAVSLPDVFTLEFFINYDLGKYKDTDTAIENKHYYFYNETSTSANKLSLAYVPSYGPTFQSTNLEVRIGTNVVTLPNAYLYFTNKAEDYYTHIALQRLSNGDIELYIDGVIQTMTLNNTATISIDSFVSALVGNLNSLRLTKGIARYTPNVLVTPNLRFGLVGGANDILDRQVFNTHYWLDKELEHDIFCC